MNKKLKMILFSSILAVSLSNRTIAPAVTAEDMTRYVELCNQICELAKEHQTTTAISCLIAAGLMAPSVYKITKKTAALAYDHSKKTLLVFALIIAYYLDKYKNKSQVLAWLYQQLDDFKEIDPVTKAKRLAEWANACLLNSANSTADWVLSNILASPPEKPADGPPLQPTEEVTDGHSSHEEAAPLQPAE